MPGAVFPAFLKLEHQNDGSARASFLAEVNSTLDSAERRFKEFSSEAQQQVDAALSVKRNNFGSLDLGVDQLKASAAAQQARAIAAREVAVATAAAAAAEGDYSQRARLAIAATQALAIEEERAAAQARAHASAAEQVQTQLNRQKSATDAVVAATRRGTDANGAVTNSTRAVRAAGIQLGQQMQDMVVQWQMGTSAVTIFTQQMPQAAFALSGLDGKVGAVARTLSGPLGAGIILATALLGPYIAELLKGGDASDKLKASSLSLTDALKLVASGNSEALKALKDYNAEAVKARDNSDSMIKMNLALAESALKVAQATREQLQAELERRNELMRAAPGAFGGDVLAPSGPTDLGTGRLESRLKANKGAQDLISQQIRELRIKDAGRDAAAAVDPIKAINNRFDDMAAAAAKAAAGNDKLSQSLEGLLTQYERQRKVALDAARESKRADTGARDLAAFGNPVPGAPISSGYGTRARPTAGASTNHLGIDYRAREGTPVLAAMDGIVKFANMVKGYGNQIELNHGGGTASRYSHLSRFNVADGQQVNKGDVIGYVGKTGVATGPHLHYEVLVNGKKVDPTKGNFPVDPTRVAEQGERARAAAQRAADQLQQLGDRSAESIARINEQFNIQPRLVDQAAQATRKLDDIIKDLSERKPAGFEQMIADAQAAKGVVQDALVRPFAELTRDSERRIQIQTLLTNGREAEASALQTIWQLEERLVPLTEERKRQIYGIAAAEEKANQALEKRREEIGAYLNATRSIRGQLESLFAGEGGDFGKIVKRLQAQLTVEKLFGDSLRKLEQTIKTGGFQTSVDTLATETDRGSAAVASFADVMTEQADRLRSGPAVGFGTSAGGSSIDDAALSTLTTAFDRAFSKTRAAANDNSEGSFDPATGEITVNGAKASVVPLTKLDRSTVAGTNLSTYSEMVAGVMTKPLVDAISQISPDLAGKLGPMLNGAIGGYMTGGIPGAVLGGLKELPGIGKGISKLLGKGLEGAQTGTMVAGLAKSVGIKKFSETGAQIGGAIGTFIPIPGGSLIGSVIGGFLGGLFKKVKSGYAQIRPSGEDVAVTGTYGRTGSLQNDAREAANGLIDTMRSLADRVGGTLGGYDQDVGTKDDKFAVTSSRLAAQGYAGGTRWFDSEEEAMRFAIRDALSAGAIKGIREGSQRLLQAGEDIERQVAKALDFENVFKRLKSYSDPVGAAIDGVDAEFKRLQSIFKEAGASTAEFADLEKLYGIERTKAVKDAMEQTTSALRGLLEDLTIGDNGLSLSDRRANAMAKYAPLAEQVKAGDVTAYDDFAQAARALLEIQRDMYGSQNPYFDLMNEVTSLTQGVLNASTATANQSAGRAGIFAGTGGGSDNGAVVGSINSMNTAVVDRLDAANTNFGILIQQNAALLNAQQQGPAVVNGNYPMWNPQGYF